MSDRKESFLIIFCTVYTCALFTVSIFVHNFFCLILLWRFSFFFLVNSALKIQNLHFFLLSCLQTLFLFSHYLYKKRFLWASMPLFLHYSLLYPSRSFLLLLLSEQKKMIFAVIYKTKCAHSDKDRNRAKDNEEMKWFRLVVDLICFDMICVEIDQKWTKIVETFCKRQPFHGYGTIWHLGQFDT